MTMSAEKYINPLQELPSQLQERVFEKIFRVAEIAKMNRQEITEYEDSLKKYRDLNSAIETAKMDGELKGKMEEKKETALKMLEDDMAIENICKYTGLSEEQINKLCQKYFFT